MSRILFLALASAVALVNCGGSTEGGTGSGTSGGASGAAGSGTSGSAGSGTSGSAGSGAGGSSGSGVGGSGADGAHACTVPSECELIPASCCGQCGAYTRDDVVALHEDDVATYRVQSACQTVDCAECFTAPDPTLVVTCEKSKCQLVDIQVEKLTDCESNAECTLRSRDCCECGGDVSMTGLIAINVGARGDYESTVCDPGTPCAQCAPSYPENAIAECLGGHCVVVWLD